MPTSVKEAGKAWPSHVEAAAPVLAWLACPATLSWKDRLSCPATSGASGGGGVRVRNDSVELREESRGENGGRLRYGKAMLDTL